MTRPVEVDELGRGPKVPVAVGRVHGELPGRVAELLGHVDEAGGFKNQEGALVAVGV